MSDYDEQQLTFGLSAFEKYGLVKPIRVKIMQGDQATMNMVQATLCKVLRDRVATPVQKLLAMRFAKDAIETFNDAFISQFQETVLPVLERQALFMKESKEPDRGKFFFSDKPDTQTAQLGNSFMRLCLENLWIWSKWFPVDPDRQTVSLYKICLERLIMQGVTFTQIQYYDFDEVVKHLPDLQVPIKMLKQCRAVIKADFKQNPQGSPLRQLAPQMIAELRSEMAKVDKQVIFYAQLFSKAYKKQTQNPEEAVKPQNKKSVVVVSEQVEFDDEVSRRSASSNSQARNFKALVKEIGSLRNEFQLIRKENETLKQQLKKLDEKQQQKPQAPPPPQLVTFAAYHPSFDQPQHTANNFFVHQMQQTKSQMIRSMPPPQYQSPIMNPMQVSMRISSKDKTSQLIEQSQQLLQAKLKKPQF